MSIATEITRLQTAKADLKTSIEGKGVTVPSATKIDGYADLVGSIPSGGGGYTVEEIFQGDEPSGVVSFVATKNLLGYAISGRRNLTELTIDLSGDYNLSGRYAITENSALQKLVLQYSETTEASSILYDYGVSGNSALATLILRGKYRSSGQSGFRGNSRLALVDLETASDSISAFGNNSFYGSNNLKTLIIRKNSVQAVSSQTFDGSGIKSSGATVYVPSSLISEYQTASQWSTLYNNGYVTFSALENSAYADIDWYKS